jgi:hypothetical protein
MMELLDFSPNELRKSALLDSETPDSFDFAASGGDWGANAMRVHTKIAHLFRLDMYGVR